MLNDFNPSDDMEPHSTTPTTGIDPNAVSQTKPPVGGEGGASSDRGVFAVDDASRKPRSAEEMEREAAWLTTLLAPSSTEDIDD